MDGRLKRVLFDIVDEAQQYNNDGNTQRAIAKILPVLRNVIDGLGPSAHTEAVEQAREDLEKAATALMDKSREILAKPKASGQGDGSGH